MTTSHLAGAVLGVGVDEQAVVALAHHGSIFRYVQERTVWPKRPEYMRVNWQSRSRNIDAKEPIDSDNQFPLGAKPVHSFTAASIAF
jgi:hypothetical protein